MQRIQKVFINITDYLQSIDFSITSWDFLIFTFFALVAIGYTFLFVTRGKLIPILMSTFSAYVLVQFAPFGLSELWQMKLALFGLIFLLTFYVLSRVILQSPVGAETFGTIPSLILALAQTGFLITVLVSYFPAEITREFSDLNKKLFLGNEALFYWGAAAIMLLLLLGTKANREVG